MQASILNMLWTCHFSKKLDEVWCIGALFIRRRQQRWIEFDFSDQDLCLFKLKVGGSWGQCCTNRHWRRRSYVRGGLTKPKVQPILPWAICPVLLHVGSDDVCATCWWEISNVCSSCLRDHSHTYCCTCFLFNKEKQKEQTRTLPVGILGSLTLL